MMMLWWANNKSKQTVFESIVKTKHLSSAGNEMIITGWLTQKLYTISTTPCTSVKLKHNENCAKTKTIKAKACNYKLNVESINNKR